MSGGRGLGEMAVQVACALAEIFSLKMQLARRLSRSTRRTSSRPAAWTCGMGGRVSRWT